MLLGLLGTVVGITIAFYDLEKVETPTVAVFSRGIGTALNTTIVGLCVAIPSNLLAHILKIRLMKWDSFFETDSKL